MQRKISRKSTVNWRGVKSRVSNKIDTFCSDVHSRCLSVSSSPAFSHQKLIEISRIALTSGYSASRQCKISCWKAPTTAVVSIISAKLSRIRQNNNFHFGQHFHFDQTFFLVRFLLLTPQKRIFILVLSQFVFFLTFFSQFFFCILANFHTFRCFGGWKVNRQLTLIVQVVRWVGEIDGGDMDRTMVELRWLLIASKSTISKRQLNEAFSWRLPIELACGLAFERHCFRGLI